VPALTLMAMLLIAAPPSSSCEANVQSMPTPAHRSQEGSVRAGSLSPCIELTWVHTGCRLDVSSES